MNSSYFRQQTVVKGVCLCNYFCVNNTFFYEHHKLKMETVK